MKTLKKLAPLFVSLWYWAIRVLGRQKSEEVEIVSRKPIKRRRSDLEEESTLWHFRSSILDRLDEYFVCIRRLRRHDSDSYDLFSRTGFSISADMFFRGDHEQNRAAFRNATNRWSFGGFFFPRTEEIQTAGIVPSFIYFRKLNRPSIAERFNGDVYSLTLIYDDRQLSEHWRSKFSYPVTCHIGVDAEGNTRLLRERVQTVSEIKTHRKHGRSDKLRLRMYSWQYPSWLFYAGIDHDKSPETFATDILVMALVTHVRSMEKIIVRVKRDGLVAAFGIELSRAKYFFADRDMSALAADGKRKRIFHSVIAHARTLSTGAVTSVRFHYRGLRHFDWNGYGIRIVFPENNRLVAYPTPARYEEDIKVAQIPEWCTSKGAGKIIAEALEV